MSGVSKVLAQVQVVRTVVARLVVWATVAVAVIIILGIVFTLADANAGNWLVRWVTRWGRWLTTPFHDLFVRTSAKQNVLINWTIATLAYLGLGSLIARVLR